MSQYGIDNCVLQCIAHARKDGLSVNEIARLTDGRDYTILEAALRLEKQGYLVSALVDDNSPVPRRVFHLSRTVRNAMKAKR